jgi:hypothetical protein
VAEVLVIVSVPVAAPVLVGFNCTFRVNDWPELRVTGKLAPETENPLPTRMAELTVTGRVPAEVSVIDCVADVFTVTLPNGRVVALILKTAVAAFSWRVNVFETPPALAVSVAVWPVVTEETVAVKAALIAPAGTVTEAGTATPLELLARFTAKPPVKAAVLNVTVQLSLPAPV